MQIRLDYLLKSPQSALGTASYHFIFIPVTLNKTYYYTFIGTGIQRLSHRMNQEIFSKNKLVMKRLWNLDTNTYENGVLDTKTKEMLGLVVRRDGCYNVMIVSGTIFENPWGSLRPGCTRSLPWQISWAAQL
jgi:hypothetical protein